MSTPVKSVSKRTTKRQQKKTSDVQMKEVVPEVIVDNGFTKSMKEDDEKEKIQLQENKEIKIEKQTDKVEKQEEKPIEKVEEKKEKVKKPVPIMFAKRNELSDFIVKESNFKGFRAPINKLISWIIENDEPIKSIASKNSKVDDKVKQLEAVKEYFICHKDVCLKQIEVFKPIKKDKEEIEQGHYFILYKKDDKFFFSCVKSTAIKANIRKHSEYEHVKTSKVCEGFDIKKKKEELKDIVDFCGRNSFMIKDGKSIDDFICFIN